MSKKIRYGAPSIPVMMPTGNLVTKANCPMRSAANTRLTPTRPAGIKLEKPAPTNLLAIGPERNATKAMGPVVAVARATRMTELTIRAIRVLSVLTPSEVADCSPSSNIPRCLASMMRIGAKINTVITRGGSSRS
ncbi:hypothetical protein D3C85_1277030 [compost metagenome]